MSTIKKIKKSPKSLLLVIFFVTVSAVFYTNLKLSQASTTTLVLENFDSYTAPSANLNCLTNFPEINLTTPGGTTWEADGTCAEGNFTFKAGGANSSTNYIEVNNVSGNNLDLTAKFTAVTDQYVYFENYIYVPTGGSLRLQALDTTAALKAAEVRFFASGNYEVRNNGGGVASGPTAFALDAWLKVKMVIDQTAKTYDFYLNDVLIISNVTYVDAFTTEKIAIINYSTRTTAIYRIDEIRIFKDTVAPIVTDFTDPTITFNLTQNLPVSGVNPNLDLTFDDTGTGAGLNFAQYRFNSATAVLKDFTSDGTTAIGQSNLAGTTYSPAAIRLQTADWAAVVNSATIYVYVQDDAGNYFENTIVVNKDVTSPTLTTATLRDLDGDGRVDAVDLIFDEAVLDSSFVANQWTFNGNAGTGIDSLTTANDNSVRVLYATDNLAVNTTVTGAAIVFNNGTSVTDAFSNNLAAIVNVTESDGVAPIILSQTLDTFNKYVEVTYSEGLYTNTGSAGAVIAGDASANFVQNTGSATAATIASTANNVGGALAGGESIIRFNLTYTGTPSGGETVAITPNATQIYDASGNIMTIAQTTGALALNDSVLQVVYAAPSIATLTRYDGVGTTYSVAVTYDGTVLFGDDPLEVADNNSFVINVKNSGGVILETFTNTATTPVDGANNRYRLKSFVYNGGSSKWDITIEAIEAINIADANNYISISKTAGTTGVILNELDSITPGPDGWGSTGNALNNFDLAAATLSVRYVSMTNLTQEQASSNANASVVSFKALYADGITEETNDNSYVVKVYNDSNVDVSANFNISAVSAYATGSWKVNITTKIATTISPTVPYYYVSISKTAGTQGDLLSGAGLNSNAINDSNYADNVSGLAALGQLVVTNATLNISYQTRSVASMERGDSVQLSYTWKVHYDNGIDEEVIDAAQYAVTIRNTGGTDITGQFTVITTPTYAGGVWTYTFATKTTATVSTGNYIEVVKSAGGTSGDTLAAYSPKANNDNDLSDGVDGLGAAAGGFAVVNANLILTYINRGNITFERANGIGTTYTFTMRFKDGTYIVNNSFGLPTAKIFQATKSGTDRTAGFSFGLITYAGSNNWTINVLPSDTAFVTNDLTLELSKTTGDLIASRDATEDISLGLAVNQGEFQVTNASLNMTYVSRNSATTEQGDDDGVMYQFQVFYDDFTTKEINDNGYRVIIRDKTTTAIIETLALSAVINTGTDFVASAIAYNAPNWEFTLLARKAAVIKDYYIEIDKLAGGENDTMAAFSSIATDDNSMADGVDGLGDPNGKFDVTIATMNINWFSQTSPIVANKIERLGMAVNYKFKLMYDNMSEEITNANDPYTSFTIKVYKQGNGTPVDIFNPVAAIPNSGSEMVGTEFDLEKFTYIAGYYEIEIAAQVGVAVPTTPDTYYISVQFTGGTSTNTLVEKLSISTPPYSSGVDDFSTGFDSAEPGSVTVVDPTLGAVYQSRSVTTTKKHDGVGITYKIQLKYAGGTTHGDIIGEQTDINAFTLRIYDSSNAVVDTISSATIPAIGGSSLFRLNSITWDGSNYLTANIESIEASTYATDYYVSIEKALGTTNTLIVEKRSEDAVALDGVFSAGLGVGLGDFDLIASEITLKYVKSNYYDLSLPSTFRRADGIGITYYFEAYYLDQTTKKTNADLTSYTVEVLNAAGATDGNTTGNFTLSAFTYMGGLYQVNIQSTALSDKMVSNYKVRAYKAAGTDGDTVIIANAKRSDAVTGTAYNGGLGVGIAANNGGEFTIIDAELHIVYNEVYATPNPGGLKPAAVSRGAVATTGMTAEFKVFYGDNVTEEMNDYGYIVKVYDSTNTQVESFTIPNFPAFPIVGTDFDLQSFAYSTGFWRVEVTPHILTPQSPGWYFSVEKGNGGENDTMLSYNSNDTTVPDVKGNTGLGAVNGSFDVAGQNLHIVYQPLSTQTIQRQDGVGVTYKWKILYPNSSEETTDKTGYKVHIYDTSLDITNVLNVTHTFNTFPSSSPYFSVSDLVYTGGFWTLNVKANRNTVSNVGNNNYVIEVEKIQAVKPDVMYKVFNERHSNIATIADVEGNIGQGANGDFTVDFATLVVQYLPSSSSIQLEHGDSSSFSEYEFKIQYPDCLVAPLTDCTLFNPTDAGVGDNSTNTNKVFVAVRDSTNTVRTAQFNIVAQAFDEAVFVSSTNSWKYRVLAPFSKAVETGFYIDVEVQSSGGGTTDDTSLPTKSSNATTGLNSLGIFDVINAGVNVAFVSVAPNQVRVNEPVTVKLRLTFNDSQPYTEATALNNLTSSLVDILRIENDQFDTSTMTVDTPQNLGAGLWQFTVTPTGSNYSKAGQKIRLSGTTNTGDLIKQTESNDILGDNGVFSVKFETILHQNFPNPFNPIAGKTQVRFDLLDDDGQKVEIKIYSMNGLLVKTFDDSDIVNRQKIYWDGRTNSEDVVAGGVYYCILEYKSFRQIIKIAVVK